MTPPPRFFISSRNGRTIIDGHTGEIIATAATTLWAEFVTNRLNAGEPTR